MPNGTEIAQEERELTDEEVGLGPELTDADVGVGPPRPVAPVAAQFPVLPPTATFGDWLQQPARVLAPDDVVPAVRMIGGEVVGGKPGDTHPDIIKREGLSAMDIDQRGFRGPLGEYLTREQAARETGLRTAFEPGRLHSTDLPAFTGEEPREFKGGVQAPVDLSKVKPSAYEQIYLQSGRRDPGMLPGTELTTALALAPVATAEKVASFFAPRDEIETYTVPKEAPPTGAPRILPPGEAAAALMRTTTGGPSTPMALYPESPEERRRKFTEGLMTPAVPLPKFEIKPDDSVPIAAAKELTNLLVSLPEFLETPLGIMTLGTARMGKPIATGVRYAFALDMVKNFVLQSKELIQDWDKLTGAQKTKLAMDIAGSGVMFRLLMTPEVRASADITRTEMEAMERAYLGRAGGQVARGPMDILGRPYAGPFPPIPGQLVAPPVPIAARPEDQIPRVAPVPEVSREAPAPPAARAVTPEAIRPEVVRTGAELVMAKGARPGETITVEPRVADVKVPKAAPIPEAARIPEPGEAVPVPRARQQAVQYSNVAEFLRDVETNPKVGSHHAHGGGLIARTIEDLGALVSAGKKYLDEIRPLQERQQRMPPGPERDAVTRQILGISLKNQTVREAIQAATDTGIAEAEAGDLFKLGQRPMDWRTTPGVMDWLQTNAKDLGYELPNFGQGIADASGMTFKGAWAPPVPGAKGLWEMKLKDPGREDVSVTIPANTTVQDAIAARNAKNFQYDIASAKPVHPTPARGDFSKKAIPALEERIGDLSNLLIDSEAFGQSEFYDASYPIPREGGITSARYTQRYASDPAYAEKVDAAIEDITQTMVRANRQRMALMDHPSSGAFGVDYSVSLTPEGKARATYGVNVVRAWHNEAKEKYTVSLLGNISIRECLQNSVDAVFEALTLRQIKQGTIDLKPTTDLKGFDADDNGVGMSDVDIGSKFLSLHSTGKAVQGRFGGFGIAKAVILGPSDTATWELRTRDNFFTHEMAQKNEVVGTLPKRQGTNIRVRTQEVIMDDTARMYVESTELPKNIVASWKGVVPEYPFKRMRGEKLTVEVNKDTSYDMTYYSHPKPDYDQKYVVRLVDEKTGAKLTQAIVDADNGDFRGAIIVDIRTTAIPGTELYPLTDSRLEVKWDMLKPVRKLIAEKTTDVISARRGKVEYNFFGAWERPEWKDTLEKVTLHQDKGYEKLAQVVRDIWTETGNFYGTTSQPFTPLRELQIKVDRGYKGYRGGTVFHAKHMLAYEAVARLMAKDANSPVSEFYGMLSKEVNGTVTNAEHGLGGKMGLTFLSVDKTALKTPVTYGLYLRDLIAHELTHHFEGAHNERFTSHEIKLKNQTAHLFPYILRIAEAALGEELELGKPRTIVRRERVEVPVERVKFVDRFITPQQQEFLYGTENRVPDPIKDQLYSPRQTDVGQLELGQRIGRERPAGLGGAAEVPVSRGVAEQPRPPSPVGAEPGGVVAGRAGVEGEAGVVRSISVTKPEIASLGTGAGKDLLGNPLGTVYHATPADWAQWQSLQERLKAAYRSGDNAAIRSTFAENEALKNKYGGNPPAPPRQIVEQGRVAGITGKPMEEDSMWFWLKDRYNIRPGGAVSIVFRPEKTEAGQFIFDNLTGKAIGIELNRANIPSQGVLHWVMEHEAAHWFDLENPGGAAGMLLDTVSAKEWSQIDRAIAKLDYSADRVASERTARAIQALADSWRNRGWFSKIVGRVQRFAHEAIGIQMTRAAAENAAVRAIAQSIRLAREAPPEVSLAPEVRRGVPPREEEPPQGAVVTPEGSISMPGPGLQPGAPSIPLKTPKSQRKIIEALSKGLKVPIQFGRLRTTKFAGYWLARPWLIGSKKAVDVPTVSHEVGHRLDTEFNFSGDPVLRAELMFLGDPASVPGSRSSWTKSKSRRYRIGEGMAEFVRYWLTDPPNAARLAPSILTRFEAILDANKDIGDTMRTAQKDITDWQNSDPQARLRSHVSIGENPNETPYTISQLTRDLVDDLHFLRLAVDDAQRYAGRTLAPSQNPYLAARNLRGAYGMAATFINAGQVDFRSKAVRLGTSLEDALKPVSGRMQDFRDWIVARRAKELHDQGRETGLLPSDVDFTANKFNGDPAFQEAFTKIKEWQDSLLQYAVDAGLVERGHAATPTSPATGSFLIREMNQDYVPFHRVFEVGAGEAPSVEAVGIGRGLNVGKPGSLKALRGSGREIVDPLETMVKNAYTIVTASEKAAINNSVAALADMPRMGVWIRRVATPKQLVRVGIEKLREQLEAAGADLTNVPDDTLLQFFQNSGVARFGENTIRIIRDGEPQFFQLKRELFDTFHALNNEDSGKLVRIFSSPAQLLRAGVTMAPDFVLANALRDTFSAAILSRYSAYPFHVTLKGLAALINDPQSVSEWAASGGRSAIEANYFDRAKLQKYMAERITKDLTPAERALLLLKSPLFALRWLTGVSEEATRIGEYKIAKDALTRRGMPEGEARRMAAYEARDRQDFAKGGSKTKILRHAAAFWNAQLQANVRLYQAFKERPLETTLKGLAFVTLAKAAEQAMNWEDEDYWDRPQWERDLFYMIPIGKGEDGHTRFFRMPVPFELGIIFGTLPGRFLEWYKRNKPEAAKGIPRLLIGQTTPNPLPQTLQVVFADFLSGAKGWDIWRGKPVVPESLADLPADLQWTDQTSLTARKIGSILGFSPMKIDHIIAGTTGGFGRQVVHNAIDRAISAVTGEPVTARGYVPGGRFVSTPAAVASQATEEFYNTLQDLREEAERYKLQKEFPPMQFWLLRFEREARAIGDINKRYRLSTDPREKIQLQEDRLTRLRSLMQEYKRERGGAAPEAERELSDEEVGIK